MADVNQQVLDALNAGYGPEDILAHMQNVAKDSPAHAAWINNLQRQTLDVRSQQNEPDTTPDYTNPNDQRLAMEAQRNALANPTQNPGGQGIKAPPSALQQFSTDVGDWYQNTPAWKKALEIGGPLALGYGIKEGIRRGASILLPTPGEKVAQEQNRISQANLELERQKLAMRGTEAPAGPSDLEMARIETERAKAEQIRASIASQAKRDELAAAKLEQQSKPKLSVEEQRLAALAEQQAQAKAATAAGAQPPAPVVEPTNPKLPALLQAPVNAPAAAAATPPENMPKKAWEPPTASLAIAQPVPVPTEDEFLKKMEEKYGPLPSKTSTVAPELSTTSAEPITSAATPTMAAEPETPAVPVATTTETPATKATNDQILETLNKVAPKPEVTSETTPTEEKLKWPGTSKGGAGAEGFALQQLGASRATYSKQHAAALEILKDRTNGILTQSPSGGGIHQQDQLSKMYEDYTGKPIPKTEKGGWARIPDSQVAELHAGILNELQEAAKGGKLKSLGKGALSAAALLGISEAVQAAQKGNFGPLKEAGFDIGIGALGGPAVMAGQMAMTGQTLASGMTPKGQKEYQNRQEILSRPGVQEQLKYLNVLNPNLSKADFNKRVDAYLATNPNAPKTKLQQFNEQTRQQQIDQTQKEHSLRK